eukprot:TRINITY_DN6237_c0_g1_i1.p1 TRINITY_DN6237_c0_g1~~TRINITY_DN6237_c0_g1_i1.p1  ORF type:complete len:258 (+),score=37.14 TRINITY_DN6237_c0_g1_i1:25-798(+)
MADLYAPVSPSQLYDTQDFEVDEFKAPLRPRSFSQAEATTQSSCRSSQSDVCSQRRLLPHKMQGKQSCPSPLFSKQPSGPSKPSPNRVDGKPYGCFVQNLKEQRQAERQMSDQQLVLTSLKSAAAELTRALDQAGVLQKERKTIHTSLTEVAGHLSALKEATATNHQALKKELTELKRERRLMTDQLVHVTQRLDECERLLKEQASAIERRDATPSDKPPVKRVRRLLPDVMTDRLRAELTNSQNQPMDALFFTQDD